MDELPKCAVSEGFDLFASGVLGAKCGEEGFETCQSLVVNFAANTSAKTQMATPLST